MCRCWEGWLVPDIYKQIIDVSFSGYLGVMPGIFDGLTINYT